MWSRPLCWPVYVLCQIWAAWARVWRLPLLATGLASCFILLRAEKTELTRRERDICAAIGPELKRRGLIFTGIDVIGDYMTEINVTSPTGIQEVARFGGADIAALVWDAIERRKTS